MNFPSRMAGCLLLVTVIPAAAAERGLIINEDNSHFFASRPADEMTLEGLHAFVDQYADTPNENSFMHSRFWRENPQFWRVPHAKGGSWVDRALDYGHPEVQAHAMNFIEELLDRYDPDGLELDWMRFGWHFKSGEEASGAETLTEFMREIRQLTNAWGEKRSHPILVGVRVPAHPDAARGLGMDGVRWAQEGLVDMLVPCPFWTTTDYDIPVELWRSHMGAAEDRVVLAPGIEHNSRAYSGEQVFVRAA